MTFAEKTENLFNKSVKTGIKECLDFLNSDIDLPTDKEGNVLEVKLATVVEAREDIVNTVYFLMDEIKSKESLSKSFEKDIVSGLEKTFYELLDIVERPMPRGNNNDPIKDQDIIDKDAFFEKLGNKMNEDALLELMGVGGLNYSDDKIKSIAKAKRVAAKVCNSIRTRISMIQDSDTIRKQKVEDKKVTSIPERMAMQNK